MNNIISKSNVDETVLKNIENELYIHYFLQQYVIHLSTAPLKWHSISDYYKYYRIFTENSSIADSLNLPTPKTLKTHIENFNNKLKYLYQVQNNPAITFSSYPFEDSYNECFCRQLKYLLQSGTFMDIFETLYKDITIEHYKHSGKYRVNLPIDLEHWKVPNDFFLLYISMLSSLKETNNSWVKFQDNVKNILDKLIAAHLNEESGISLDKSLPRLIRTNYDIVFLENIYDYILRYHFPENMLTYLKELDNCKYFGMFSSIVKAQVSQLKNYRFPCPINTATGINIFYKRACEKITAILNSTDYEKFFTQNISQQLDDICFECALLESEAYEKQIKPNISSLSMDTIITKIQEFALT